MRGASYKKNSLKKKTVHSCQSITKIILNCCVDCRKEHEKCEFEMHEVYAIDILVSTGEGKVRNTQLHYINTNLSFYEELSTK
jgi:hypothetical protein